MMLSCWANSPRLLDPQNEGGTVPQNVRHCLCSDTVPHTRRSDSSENQ